MTKLSLKGWLIFCSRLGKSPPIFVASGRVRASSCFVVVWVTNQGSVDLMHWNFNYAVESGSGYRDEAGSCRYYLASLSGVLNTTHLAPPIRTIIVLVNAKRTSDFEFSEATFSNEDRWQK